MTQTICPIIYESIPAGQKYSVAGIHRISTQLKALNDLPANMQQEAIKFVDQWALPGTQLKVSAKIVAEQNQFVIIGKGGRFILKPQHPNVPELPQNEDLTMRLAKLIGIEVPLHGMIYSADNSLTYFIKRFDRINHGKKMAVEDFAQLTDESRMSKYSRTLEDVVRVLNEHATFPLLEKYKLLQRVLFNFLVGNNDLHLKKIALINRDGKVELAPAYGWKNMTIVDDKNKNQMALSLNNKQSDFTKKDFIEYFACQKLTLRKEQVLELLQTIQANIPSWKRLIEISFLSDAMKKRYAEVLDQRSGVLEFSV